MQNKIIVEIKKQQLCLLTDNNVRFQCKISSAKNGTGQLYGSECTPLGKHIVRAKIGDHMPANTVFRGRRPSGEIYSRQLGVANPDRDWILTRILWLSGKEPGLNRLGKVDTMRRYIYIHGCPDDHDVGTLSSHGCIKLHNEDIIKLFDMVKPYTCVEIEN